MRKEKYSPVNASRRGKRQEGVQQNTTPEHNENRRQETATKKERGKDQGETDHGRKTTETNKNISNTMGDYGWSMDFGTSQGSVAVEYGRVLEYPKKRNKSQTTRKPDLFR